VVPLGIIILLVLTALLGNVLTPYSPVNISLPERLRPPCWEQGGSLAHPLGTDPMGRDLLTRLIYGARISLLVGFLGLLAGGGVGTALGLIAGYAGGRLDAFLMRVTDTTLSFPIILFAILLVVILGSSLLTVVFAVALVLWARFARVIRERFGSGNAFSGAGSRRWQLVSADHEGAPSPMYSTRWWYSSPCR
jgi:peptide/nickel transport system permease protein